MPTLSTRPTQNKDKTTNTDATTPPAGRKKAEIKNISKQDSCLF
jgi:hypothetical protein